MSFTPGSTGSGEEKNVFLPDSNRIELETSVDSKSQVRVAEFTMVGEDDRMGQLLRKALEEDKRVSFVAYRIPHREEDVLKLRFHLVSNQEDPILVLQQAIDVCISQLTSLQKQIPPRATAS